MVTEERTGPTPGRGGAAGVDAINAGGVLPTPHRPRLP